ncbi:MAG: hypothetical protein ACREBO_01375 [Novosphingobium sp.]
MRSAALFAALFAVLAVPAFAKDKDDEATPPPVFQAVVDCKAIPDAAQRLACYDRTVAAMAAANQAKDLAVFDRTTMREARRGIFGLRLPRLKLFGGGDSEEVMEIDSTITSVHSAKDGMPIFVLADGAQWKQTDGRNVFPKAGDAIHIRRAAMGSFMANVAKQPGVRVMRLAN